MNALKISNIFTDKFNQIVFTIKPKQKKFELYSQNQDVGENNITIDSSLTGDDVELSFNYKYLLDCFQAINEDSISLRLNQNNRPMVLGGVGDSSFLYLVMPMNR